jgi:DNA-binding transcriptional regulator YiaG
MKKNITTLDQLIEEHYGKVGSASRNEFEWGAQLFKISAMIKIARQNLKLTQREFAKKCNTSYV